MKNITLVVRQTQIGRLLPDGLQLSVNEDACILDVIKAFDKELTQKIGAFPVKGFQSLLQMTYHPYETRFYKQVAVQAYTPTESFLEIRDHPEMTLPDKTMIILIPEGGCATDWEMPVMRNMEKEE